MLCLGNNHGPVSPLQILRSQRFKIRTEIQAQYLEELAIFLNLLQISVDLAQDVSYEVITTHIQAKAL